MHTKHLLYNKQVEKIHQPSILPIVFILMSLFCIVISLQSMILKCLIWIFPCRPLTSYASQICIFVLIVFIEECWLFHSGNCDKFRMCLMCWGWLGAYGLIIIIVCFRTMPSLKHHSSWKWNPRKDIYRITDLESPGEYLTTAVVKSFIITGKPARMVSFTHLSQTVIGYRVPTHFVYRPHPSHLFNPV